MYSWKEDFGKFWTNSNDYKSPKRIYICTNQEMTGEDMVIMALKMAKRFNCVIVGRVEYSPDEIGGKQVFFDVKCDKNTYRYFYDGGRLSKPRSYQIKESDIVAYEEKFGTRKCVDNYISKNRFYFTDNWNGEVLKFPTLQKAKEAAKKQSGNSCCIYETQPYGRGSKIICFAQTSDYTYP